MASVTAVSAVAVTGLVLVPPLVERDQAPRPAPTTTTLPPAAAPGRGGGGTGVRLVGRGESPFRVRSGQRASFTGRLVPNPPGFARRAGIVPAEGAALVERQGYHIEVAYADITLEP